MEGCRNYTCYCALLSELWQKKYKGCIVFIVGGVVRLTSTSTIFVTVLIDAVQPSERCSVFPLSGSHNIVFPSTRPNLTRVLFFPLFTLALLLTAPTLSHRLSYFQLTALFSTAEIPRTDYGFALNRVLTSKHLV